MVWGSIATTGAQEQGRSAHAVQVRLRPGPDGGLVPEGHGRPREAWTAGLLYLGQLCLARRGFSSPGRGSLPRGRLSRGPCAPDGTGVAAPEARGAAGGPEQAGAGGSVPRWHDPHPLLYPALSCV